MIAFLKGILAGRSSMSAYVDVHGVGYEVLLPAADLAKLADLGSEVQLLTYLQISDAGATLYGFLTNEEKALFERLIAVTGVGPKMALAALSTFAPKALADAVMAQDVALISRIPGVGKKTASRIILELKGSFEHGGETLFGAQESAPVQDGAAKVATEALLSMGFTSTEAELALKGAPDGATEGQLLQFALRKLGS